jgi:hypothetical protein
MKEQTSREFYCPILVQLWPEELKVELAGLTSHENLAYLLAYLVSRAGVYPSAAAECCSARPIPFVVETLSLLLVVSAPLQLHIAFPLRLCSSESSLMSSLHTPLTNTIPSSLTPWAREQLNV